MKKQPLSKSHLSLPRSTARPAPACPPGKSGQAKTSGISRGAVRTILTALWLTPLLWGCRPDQKNGNTHNESNAILVESTTIVRREGQCDDDSYNNKCAEISLSRPVIKNAPRVLEKKVARWTRDFLCQLLDPGLEQDEETSLNLAIESFFEMHREMVMEMPDMPGHYVVEVTDTILLLNDQYLTLRLDGYSYTGGAHPNTTSAIATFDLQTGKRLGPSDFVDDLEKLYKVAEQKFRETRKEEFEEGFDFSESWPFVIAENVGLTTKGLLFCYVPYEVAPYVMGFTEFVIPYDELEKL